MVSYLSRFFFWLERSENVLRRKEPRGKGVGLLGRVRKSRGKEARMGETERVDGIGKRRMG